MKLRRCSEDGCQKPVVVCHMSFRTHASQLSMSLICLFPHENTDPCQSVEFQYNFLEVTVTDMYTKESTDRSAFQCGAVSV